jgi:putative transposase
MITPDIEPLLFNLILSKAIGLGGYVYALNGTEDHVHLAAHIPRTISVAQYIGKVQGASSTRFNKMGISPNHFYWQSEYSIFTISEFMVPKIVQYVKNQKNHHKQRSIDTKFEIIMKT